MVSNNLRSSLTVCATIVTVPIGLATLALTQRGSNLLIPTSRKARTALRPSKGSCKWRLWVDLKDGPLYLHVDGERLPDVAYERPVVLGKILITSLSKWNEDSHAVGKLECLPLPKESLHVDLRVNLPFVFRAILLRGRGKQTTELSSRTFSINIVVLEVQIIKPDIVALHLGGTIQRTFTKDYVQRLLGGHPDCL
ncbi:hypothetical protein KXX29_005952 [Aspergillus fumigatus]|nr:hypothetical protein KXX29_005952 [Aspergillus fumigatus]KAH2024764.1 hypothetical protein KXV45_009314 [Aspergillus fumigatus]KAH2229699.1 hypothetical protein KXV37_004012 [Aspergillus fumigatus]KAH2380621.1 hypothetical protein KXV62_008639 [Aspergillus fumigatus]KAH3184895.1 hypothetical protein KXW84_002798 [Aspergillus fumigatus]